MVTLDLMKTRETITLAARTQERLLVLPHILAGELDPARGFRRFSLRGLEGQPGGEADSGCDFGGRQVGLGGTSSSKQLILRFVLPVANGIGVNPLR